MKYQFEWDEIKCCVDCPLSEDTGHDAIDWRCLLTYADIENIGAKPDWCPLVKVTINCDRAEKTADGRCLGYGKSEDDDEPIEKCKQCEKQSSYESEGE